MVSCDRTEGAVVDPTEIPTPTRRGATSAEPEALDPLHGLLMFGGGTSARTSEEANNSVSPKFDRKRNCIIHMKVEHKQKQNIPSRCACDRCRRNGETINRARAVALVVLLDFVFA